MLMAYCYLTYPLLFINKFVLCRLTNRPFIWLSTYTADFIVLCLFLYAFGWHILWLNAKNAGLKLDVDPSAEMMYVEDYFIHITNFEINVQFYVGFWLLVAFLRQLLSWTVTQQLGPIVSTIIVMFKDVGQFLVVWFFVLLAFSSVGFITFREVEGLGSMEDAMFFFFQVAFVNFDLDAFDVVYADRPVMKRLGKYFVLLFLFINAVILLNVVIAMMADTYGFMTNLRIGIYNHSVIKTAPSYASNKQYGALAFLPAPFAIISFFTIPYYLCVKDKERL